MTNARIIQNLLGMATKCKCGQPATRMVKLRVPNSYPGHHTEVVHLCDEHDVDLGEWPRGTTITVGITDLPMAKTIREAVAYLKANPSC